jgi:hypothetical protein
MDSLNRIDLWQKPAYLPYLQPVLTNEILAAAEAQMGYTLPAELVALLRIQNGGYIRYRLPESPHEIINGIGPRFPSLNHFDWEEEQEYVSFALMGLVPLDGDGHWYLCLDYRSDKDNPAVSYIDVECDEEQIVAPNFAAYLKMLVPEVNGELVIQTDESIEVVARQMETILGTDFEGPDYFNQGYAIYRSRYKESWVWLTPNTVPAGFIREGETCEDAFMDMVHQTALRYGELPANALLLELSEESLYPELADNLRVHGSAVAQLKNELRSKKAD